MERDRKGVRAVLLERFRLHLQLSARILAGPVRQERLAILALADARKAVVSTSEMRGLVCVNSTPTCGG